MSNRSSTKKYIYLLSLVILLSIGALAWLGMHEWKNGREFEHILNQDFKRLELEYKKLEGNSRFNPSVHIEIKAHLNDHIQRSHQTLFIISVSSLVLLAGLIINFLYLQRLKKFNANKEELEELLYYKEIYELYEGAHVNENLQPGFKALALDREKFLSELRNGLEKQQFKVFYQPIVHADSGRIHEVEALVRWQHPEYGLLNPGFFLPACENSGLIIPLGEWILQTACAQITKWHEQGFDKLGLSVNLSAKQLQDPNLQTLIKTTLARYKLSASYLKLEITEHALTENIEHNAEILKSLRQLGIQFSLDDFGTGYSSLNYLKQFPVSVLKIDRSFIADFTTNITSLGIVDSVIRLAKNLGLIVIAEGVENPTQLHLLKKMNCDFIQGYLFSPPVPAQNLTPILLESEKTFNHKTLAALHTPSTYQYEILQTRHREQAIKLIAQTFCAYEPMTQYLGITPQEFNPFAEIMVDKAIQDGLSIVALDQGKVIGSTIVEDIAAPLDITIDIDPRFKIIFGLLESLSSEFFKERVITHGRVAHLFITAVDPHYFGKGLSRKINFESIKLARQKGFDYMCCEFTNDYNEKGTVKNLGSSRLLIHSCVYKDFVFDDSKPFAKLEGAARAYIWELREGVQLPYRERSLCN